MRDDDTELFMEKRVAELAATYIGTFFGFLYKILVSQTPRKDLTKLSKLCAEVISI